MKVKAGAVFFCELKACPLPGLREAHGHGVALGPHIRQRDPVCRVHAADETVKGSLFVGDNGMDDGRALPCDDVDVCGRCDRAIGGAYAFGRSQD